MRRCYIVLCGLIPGALLLACAQQAAPVADPGADSGQALATQRPPADGARVRLLDPGAEPRRALRYRFAPQARMTLEFTLDTARKITTSHLSLPEIQGPTLKLWVAIQPEPVRADGALRYALRLERTEVLAGDDPSPALDTARAELAGFVGLAGFGLVDPRGFTLQADAQLPPEADLKLLRDEAEDLRQQLLRLAVPLPEEPVGPGARWEVREELAWVWMRLGREVHAFHGEQTVVYRLTGLDGDRLQLEVELSRVFPPQELLPSNELGSPGKLEALKTQGTGRLRLDLQTPLSEGSLSLVTHKRMAMRPRGPDGPARESTTDTTSKLTLRHQTPAVLAQ